MNLFTTKLRRGATVAGGTILGLGIVASMAGPALACKALVSASSECGTDGGWVANFQVGNDYDKRTATISSIKVNGEEVASIGNINTTTTISEGSPLQGSLNEPADVRSVKLEITMKWEGVSQPNEQSATAWRPRSTHCTTSPTTEPTTTAPTTAPTTEPTTTAPTTAPTTEPTTTAPTTTPPTTEVPLPTPSDTPSTEPTLPDEIFAVDCDSMTIGLDNTKGEIEYKIHFKPSTGAEKDLDIKAGEKKSVTFDASEGFSVELSIVAIFEGNTSEAETVVIPYETPADCSGEGGGLPVTGAAAGGIAGGAAVLLAAGAGLFVMARRRKVRFTA